MLILKYSDGYIFESASVHVLSLFNRELADRYQNQIAFEVSYANTRSFKFDKFLDGEDVVLLLSLNGTYIRRVFGWKLE